MATIPAAEWMPDQPPVQNPISGTVKNCVPLTDKSYGPLMSLAPSYSALNGRAQGAFGIRDNSQSGYIFAGTGSKLYELSASTSGWADVTNANNSYVCAVADTWRFLLFGQDVIATDYEDPLQVFALGSSSKFADLAQGGISSLVLVAGSGYTNGTFALSVTGPGSGSGFVGTVTVASGALSSFAITVAGRNYPQTATIAIPGGAGGGSAGSITPVIADIAPQAKFMAVVKDFVMLGNTTDGVNGKKTQRLWWGGAGNDSSWKTPGTSSALAVQSDFQDILGDFGDMTGIVTNLPYADAAVFFERAVFRVNYTGPPVIFDILPASGVRGCLYPNSITLTPVGVVYLGEDGFYLFDGLQAKSIGFQKWDRTINADVNPSLPERFVSTIDPVNKYYVAAYPQVAQTNCNRMLFYNWMTGRMTFADALTIETLVTAPALGFTEETVDQGLYNADTLPYSYDSPVWTGSGRRSIACFDATHTLNYFTGTALAPTVETQEVAPGRHRLAHIRRATPLVDGGTPSLTPVTRNRMEDAPVLGTASAMNADGYCPLHVTARFHRMQITLPAAASWQHIQGVDVPDDAVSFKGSR